MRVLDKVSDREIIKEYRRRFFLKPGDRIQSSKEAADHFRVMFGRDVDRECFIVIFLNGQNALICSEILFRGTLTTSAVYPREIIKKALENHAAAILCGHNHPSGNLTPSRDDITITKKIKMACDTVDVALHDHLIVTGEGYTSFADQGLI